MKASSLHRVIRWLAPSCVFLPLLLWWPRDAEPTPRNATTNIATIGAPQRIVMTPTPATASTVHVVLTRGPQRLALDLPLDGKVSPDTADAIAHIMRCRVSGRTRRIASGTLALLADVAVRYPGREIEIVSAVRDEPDRTREGLKHSKHWSGHAIDIIVRDANLAEVRDVMWKSHTGIGVGWYPTGGFIHLDHRPGDHDTAWTQQRPNADNQYHPRWAKIARDPDLAAAVMRAQMRRFVAKSATLSNVVTVIGGILGHGTAGIGRDRSSS